MTALVIQDEDLFFPLPFPLCPGYCVCVSAFTLYCFFFPEKKKRGKKVFQQKKMVERRRRRQQRSFCRKRENGCSFSLLPQFPSSMSFVYIVLPSHFFPQEMLCSHSIRMCVSVLLRTRKKRYERENASMCFPNKHVSLLYQAVLWTTLFGRLPILWRK